MMLSLAVLGLLVMFAASFFLPTSLALGTILIFSMTMGLFQYAGLTLALPKAVAEGMMVVLLLKALARASRTGRWRMPGWWAIGGSALCGVLSGVAHGADALALALYVRGTLNFYLLFVAVLNLPVQPGQARRALWLAAMLFALQIPAGLVDFAIKGIEEKFIGTVHASAGQLGLLVPLFAASMLLSAYLHTWRVAYLVGIALFILFGVLGEKRGTVFAVPALLALLVGIHIVAPPPGQRLFRITWRQVKQFFSSALVILLLGGMAFYLGARMLRSLNPDNEVGGRFDPAFVLDYAQRYNWRDYSSDFNDRNLANTGVQMGRFELVFRSAELMSEQTPFTCLFGFGGGFVNSSYLVGADSEVVFRRLQLRGTFPNIAIIMLESGFAGALFYLAFHGYFAIRLLTIYRHAAGTRRILTFGALGMNLTFLFDTLAYSTVFGMTGVLTPTYFLLLAFLWSRSPLFDNGTESPAAADGAMPPLRRGIREKA